MNEEKTYDLLIIGAGPAGLTASIYASRYGLKNAIIGQMPGGQASEAHILQNWPGNKEINGMQLMQQTIEQAQALGGELIYDSATAIKKEGNLFLIETSFSGGLKGKSLIIATGTQRKKLSIPGEEEFVGKGVAYCATCDGPLYKGKTVAVVGGGNSAVGAAIYLSTLAKKVYLLARKECLRAEAKTIEDAKKQANLEIHCGVEVQGIKGAGKVEKILLSTPVNGSQELALDGVFIEIGSLPVKDLMNQLGIETNEAGFILVKDDRATNVAGVFAAGDCTNGHNMLKQIITACADGAVAANAAFKYYRSLANN
ncbi:MAG: FAD-dependent oxidoreductase [Candidatus Paceibacterota bacterium]